MEATTTSTPPVDSAAPPKTSFRRKLFNLIVPTVPEFKFSSDIEKVFLGLPGFLCTKAALRPGIEGLNGDGFAYVPWGEIVDFGFTKPIVKHVDDCVKAMTQAFGDQISVHGNSLGGFLAYFAAYSNPKDIDRLVLTASPHLLTLDPKTLTEHTNIAAYIGLMNNPLLAKVMSLDAISLWARFRAGDLAEDVQSFLRALENIEILTAAASKDTTVRGRMCLTSATNDFLEKLSLDPNYSRPQQPVDQSNIREIVVPGDHVDVLPGAVEAIRFLANRPLHAQLPPAIASNLLSVEAVQELERRTTGAVFKDFVSTSLPERPILPGMIGPIQRAVNAPVSRLRSLMPGREIQGPVIGMAN